ncbi:hypothetical protein BJY00DRAFT_59245 [Aspergillus carlsbadensis]|nr:hypothetical protein BJY00DRAFT_59245 [Aspergillus carlsbadensis]
MDLSRIRSPLSLLPTRKPVWPNPEASIGKFYGTIKGKYKYWEAVGPAQEAYREVCDTLQDVLNSSCDPVRCSSVVNYDIYMIGRTSMTAVPHIMFSCKQPESRKQAMAAVRKSGILIQHAPGMDLGHWVCPPHIVNLRLLASSAASRGAGSRVPNVFCSTRPVLDPNSPARTLAMQLVVQKRSIGGRTESQRSATIGALVEQNGKKFYLAPEHVFSLPDLPYDEIFQPQHEVADYNDCELGAFSDDCAVTDDEVEFMSQYSLSPAASDAESDSESYDEDLSDGEWDDEPSDSQPALPNSEPRPVLGKSHEHETQHSQSLLEIGCVDHHVKGPSIVSNELDYVLIEADPSDEAASHLPIMSRENVAVVQTDKVTVTTVTGSGRLLRGILSASPSYLRLPDSASFQKVFTVLFENHLLPGDSGSLVRDAETGLIYGHIIAGSSEARLAYIIPADAVLTDLTGSSEIQDIASYAGHELLPSSIIPRGPQRNIYMSASIDQSWPRQLTQ